MPPRKSDVAKVVTGDEGTPAKEIREGVNIEDLNLPKSIVTRLAKGVLPPNTQIQGNAMLAMQKSATVFVNYLASAANTHAQKAQRKTISPQDVFQALHSDLEFPDFIPRLEAELAKFNEISTVKRNTYRKKVAADKAAGKGGSPHEDGDETVDEGARDENGQPATKKARREDGGKGSGHDVEGAGERLRDMDVDDDGGDDHEEEGNEEGEEEEEEGEEHFQVEEDPLEEPEEREGVDEALDNGEDSD